MMIKTQQKFRKKRLNKIVYTYKVFSDIKKNNKFFQLKVRSNIKT